MIVTTSANYSLFVDGVAWVPTTTEGESDVYAIASGGRFVFYDERGNVMFSFYNQYTGDFAFIGQVNGYQKAADDAVVTVQSEQRKYVQMTTNYPRTVSFQVNLMGDYTASPAATTEPTTNNGEVSDFDIDTERIRIVVTGGDMGKYTQIKLGNVLLLFAVGRI